MALDVMPTIYIGGRKLACTAAALDTEPVAVRGFKIAWGRNDYHDSEAEPASLTMSLVDSTGDWAQRIKESRAIGAKLRIEWNGTPTGEGDPVNVVMFRGRITTAQAAPVGRASDGRRRWEIELTAADRTADLGSATAGPGDWPQESMLTRANRIKNMGIAAGSEIEQIYFFPGYVGSRCAPLEVKNKSALDLMGEMYQSMGNDSWAFDPGENVVRQVIRLSQPISIHLGSFDNDLGAVYPVPSDIVVDNVTYPGVGIGACNVAGEVQLTANNATDINRLECSWKDYSTGHRDWTTVKEMVAAGDTRRVMQWASWFDAGQVIDPTLENVWDRVRQEGRRPRHPDMTLPATFQFATARLAQWWLQCWENTRPAYLSGSLIWQWLMGTTPDYPPVVAPIGGDTEFIAGKGWQVQLRVHWLHNQTPPATVARWQDLPQVRISWEQPSYPWWYEILKIPLPPPVKVGARVPERDLTWGEVSAGAGYRFGNSVTWGDMRQLPNNGLQIQDHLT